jgi:hypothetical protein
VPSSPWLQCKLLVVPVGALVVGRSLRPVPRTEELDEAGLSGGGRRASAEEASWLVTFRPCVGAWFFAASSNTARYTGSHPFPHGPRQLIVVGVNRSNEPVH